VASAGPNHVNVYISPRRGVELIWWSIGEGDPEPTFMPTDVDRETYFIFYSYGTFKQPFDLTIDLQVSRIGCCHCCSVVIIAVKCTIVELGAWDRQTDRQTDA